ncbi:DUF742 domain-containing protein [Streptomyces sp. NPDC047014]|uniref:DUF742 domain-containing protein n=1 Tax=Streptomyces sp. NPDC047014 TaxID=3155736 RepID=UPI0033F96A18
MRAAARDTPWLDEAAGRVTRPYTASGGRTRPGVALDPGCAVVVTGVRPAAPLGPEHALVLRVCAGAATVPVAEVARRLRLPGAVAQVLISDLVQSGALTAARTRPLPADDHSLLLAVLDGLRRRL